MFKILICDNDLTYLQNTKLQKYNLELALCEDEILDKTLQKKFDIFISNIYYFNTFKSLKDTIQNSKVIFTDEYYNINNMKKAYEVGDDYILKPFDTEFLEIKLDYYHKKIYKNAEEIIKYKQFFFHSPLKQLYKNNIKIKLSPNEAKLVENFLLNKNKPISKDMLLDELNTSDGTLRVYISKLKKVGFDITYERVNHSYMLS